MTRLFLIFNHTFTPEQAADARQTLGVETIVSMPDAVRECWGQIPPDRSAISDYLEPVRTWLADQARPGDYVLVQGDFGACYLMVRYAFDADLIPIYATTRREADETVQQDGSVTLTHRFRHVAFRRYGE
jgi:hypothetical protein